jgi:protein involved in temperature-dependent protein secretion
MAAGLAAALAATTVPSVASAQRQQAPGPDTKRVLVTTFRGDQEGGVKLADEIRNRVQGDFSIRTLMPTSKKDIDNTLVQSGYKPDSALSPNDIKELAKLVRGDEVIDGSVQKAGAGYRVTARLFLPRDVSLSQPLVTNLETSNLGDAAKQIVGEYDKARKQIADNQACENGIRNNTPAVAIAAARKGITTYPKATISRLCLASAYAAMKTTADSTGPWKDSVISITKEIMNLDKASRIAFQLQYDAYKSKNDTTNALQALVGLMNADPTNTTLREQVISELVTSGKADIAVPTAKALIADNPGDPQYARTYWLVLRAANNFKESVPAGIAYVSIDTAAADTNYYKRQIQDLAADSGFAKAAEMAATGSAKFPRNSQLLVLKAQNERKAGQLPAAKASLERALAVDPKIPGANLLLAQIANDLGSIDDAIKAVKADVAADPTNKERDSQFMLGLGSAAYKAAVASKKPEDFQKAITVLKASDEINANAQAKFFIAVAAFAQLQQAAETLPKSKSCDEFKSANDLLSTVTQYMPGGGSVNPDAAKQILGAVPQFSAFIDGSMKKFCK